MEKVFITDWAVVKYPEVKVAVILEEARSASPDIPECPFPESVFANYNDARPISLLGRVVDDHRADLAIGCFADSHQIMTTKIKEINGEEVTTENTIYILGEINEGYKQWCELNGVAWSLSLK